VKESERKKRGRWAGPGGKMGRLGKEKEREREKVFFFK